MNDLFALPEHNDLQHLLVAAGLFAASWLLLTTLRGLIVARLERVASASAAQWDDLLLAVVRATRHAALFMLSLMLGLRLLTLTPTLDTLLGRGMSLVFILQAGLWLQAALSVWLDHREQQGQARSDAQLQTNLTIIRLALKFVLWTVVVLLLLDNLGFNITTLVASLGIGGVAVALAVQNILGDLFASLSITLDKPFLVGDSIEVGELSGTVRHVGLKTTRIQSVTGEEVIIANGDLLKSRIRNYRRMAERRVSFRFGLNYDTPTATLRELPAQLRALVESIEHTRFGRAHLARLGDSSLDFEVVYHVTTPDYGDYMDIQQRINLGLLELMQHLDVGFAFQTRTLEIAWPEAWRAPQASAPVSAPSDKPSGPGLTPLRPRLAHSGAMSPSA